MYVIISASDMETSLSMSEQICKTLVPINGKPVLQYILDELYSKQGFIDEVVIVRRDVEDIKNFLKYNKQDDFFLTKVHCVDGKTYKHPTIEKYSFLDDFYNGMEFLVDELKVSPSEILLWRADELFFNANRMIDFTTGSFKCERNIKVYRFDNFINTVNTLVYLKEDLNPHTIDDFISLYSKKDVVSTISDFGDYKEWKDRNSYYELQSELIQNDEHSSIFVEIDLEKDTITKINRYIDEPYSFVTNEKSRRVQYNLWSESNFLESLNAEQAIFLPEFIERGINKRGNYCDTLTEEFIYGTSLKNISLESDFSESLWDAILRKVVSIQRDVFHKDDLEDTDELYHSYVPKKRREEYIDEYIQKLSSCLLYLTQKFSEGNERETEFILSNNDIAEWKMFLDVFLKEYEKNITKDTLIYNGSCERWIHNNLLFENIIYDNFTNKVSFINPRSREHDLLDKNKDFARLYLSAHCGIDALLNNKYTEDKGIISLSDRIRRNMSLCEDVLDNIFENNTFLKKYALCLMLEMACSEELSTRRQVALIKYLNQLKKVWLFK